MPGGMRGLSSWLANRLQEVGERAREVQSDRAAREQARVSGPPVLTAPEADPVGGVIEGFNRLFPHRAVAPARPGMSIPGTDRKLDLMDFLSYVADAVPGGGVADDAVMAGLTAIGRPRWYQGPELQHPKAGAARALADAVDTESLFAQVPYLWDKVSKRNEALGGGQAMSIPFEFKRSGSDIPEANELQMLVDSVNKKGDPISGTLYTGVKQFDTEIEGPAPEMRNVLSLKDMHALLQAIKDEVPSLKTLYVRSNKVMSPEQLAGRGGASPEQADAAGEMLRGLLIDMTRLGRARSPSQVATPHNLGEPGISGFTHLGTEGGGPVEGSQLSELWKRHMANRADNPLPRTNPRGFRR